jgi:hypothetical protein
MATTRVTSTHGVEFQHAWDMLVPERIRAGFPIPPNGSPQLEENYEISITDRSHHLCRIDLVNILQGSNAALTAWKH